MTKSIILFLSCTLLIAVCPADGRDYYLDAVNGSDANPGTEALPWRTYRNIVTYYHPNQRPANWVPLQPGDTVYFKNGIYAFTYRYYDSDFYDSMGLFLRSVHGTPAAPIILKAYPGHSPIINTSLRAFGIAIQQSSNIVIDGLEVTNCHGFGIYLSECNRMRVRCCRIHNNDGEEDHNIAGLHIGTVDDAVVEHSIFYDNYDRYVEGNPPHIENSRQIVIFGGGNVHIRHCYFHLTPPISAAITGCGIGYKHSSVTAGASFEVNDCIFQRCGRYSIQSGTARSHIHHNLFIDGGGVEFKDVGGRTEILDEVVEYNTFVNSGDRNASGLHFNPTSDYPWAVGPVTFRRNIVVDRRSSHNIDRAMAVIGTYQSDSLYQQVVYSGNLRFIDNCYHSPNTTPRWSLFAANGGSRGSLGTLADFTGWQNLGFDSGSVVADPQFDGRFVPRNSAAQAKGRFADASPFLLWQHTHFNFEQLVKPDISGASADPDGDGDDNWTEFQNRTNPLDAATGTLSLSPAVQSVGVVGGVFGFAVDAAGPWSWVSAAPWITSFEAANQSGTQAFTFSVAHNDGPERVGEIRITSGGTQVTHRVIQAGSPPPVRTVRPDLLIGRFRKSLLGDGIYNTTGAGQTSMASLRYRRAARFTVFLENDGDEGGRIRATGSGRNRRLRPRYFDLTDGFTNVTSRITTVGWEQFFSVGAVARFELRVKPSRRLRKRWATCQVRAESSGAGGQADSVHAGVRRRR